MWFLGLVTQPLPKTPPAHVDAVLPPDGKGRAPAGQDAHDASEVSRIIAYWMDEFLRIPGTNIRLGLDPILGLFPVAGGLLSSSVSLVTMIEGVRLRLPISVLARMGANIFFNEVLDAIPVAGDFASIFFRSNTRNLALINRWKSGEQAGIKRSSRLLLAGFLILFFLLLGGWFFLWFTVLRWIWHRITG
ncbi:MAG: DUF4112 domain-containing protein [Verrucomicrobia bacterium]|nr:DUF4112 domain-containing protein [Verrucomicrobiota bacterium]